MKKTGLIFSAVVFSFFIIHSSSAFAHEGDHDDSYENGSAKHQKFEEGSGSSAVRSSMEKAEKYQSGHEGAENKEGYSYRQHRKEMKDMEKNMREGMHMPAGTSGKMMEEGSGKK